MITNTTNFLTNITFKEIRNLLNETIIQIEIIEKLINANSKKISKNNDFDSSDDSICSSNRMFIKFIPTVPTPQSKGK